MAGDHNPISPGGPLQHPTGGRGHPIVFRQSGQLFGHLRPSPPDRIRTELLLADNRTSHVLPDLILPPGGFHQYNGILNLAGFDNGYVTVERVEGPSPFYAYGVINDQVNSDGSFVFPVTASSLSGAREQTLPVIIEHSNFSSELIVTNFSSSTKELKFSFVADAVQNSRRTALFFLTLGAGEQRIIPEIVEHLRRQEVDGIGPAGRTLAGAVFAAEASGDMSGVVIGARTGSPGGGGQYSVFYNAVPNGAAFSDRTWIDALQQNGENRSNLALVNTGEADGGSSVFEIEIYDGDTGGLVNTVGGIGVPARGWHQINRILRDYAPGITQGYVRVRKTAGNNPFLAYGVINDGGAPGQRSGDGAYLPSAARVMAPKPDPTVDREALEALYNAIGGPRWSDRTNWLSQVPLGDWYGVGTDGSGRVISLDLSFNQLSGPIPPELSALSNLQRLSLEGNQLSGPIPPELSALSNLKLLSLEANQLSGPIPAELSALSNLQWLHLGANQLSGPIPPELSALSNLQSLSLAFNQLSGSIPAELSALSSLQWLSLQINQLSGSIPAELSTLSNLQRLSLWANQLSGPIPAELSALSNLQSLSLAFNQLSGPVPAELSALSSLESLDLEGNQLSGPVPSELSALSNLQRLSLWANQLSGPIPAELSALSNLQSLSLAFNQLSGPVPAELSALSKLESLDLEGNQLRGPIPAELSALSKLQRLSLEGNRLSGPIPPDLPALTNLQWLFLGFNPDLTGTLPPELQQLPLSTLDLMATSVCVPDNMGLSHDRYLDRGLLPFSHGYVNQQAFADGAPDSSRWRTIMSYPNQCSDRVFDCDWILRFSNPNQTWLGDPLGVPGSNRTAAVSGPADASRLLNITRHSVSSFRPQSSGNQPTISSAPSPSPSMVGADQAPAPIPGGGLFQAIAPNTAGAGLHRAVSALDRNPVRWRQVSVDIGRLVRVPDDRPTALSLNLFDDLVLTGIIDRRTQTYSGGYALSRTQYR